MVDSLAGSGLCPSLVPSSKIGSVADCEGEDSGYPAHDTHTQYVCCVRVEDGRVEIVTSLRRSAFTIIQNVTSVSTTL